ncbi:hypothetical protein L218DRAFT_803637, partial [Marasmius fiardii PR-910]
YLQFEIQWSSLAFLYYDYILTFPMELKYIWGSKFRLSTVLYVWCRYAMIANVLYLLGIANRFGDKVSSITEAPVMHVLIALLLYCDTVYKAVGALSVLGRAAVIVAFSARTYAIYNRNRWILVYFSLLGFACIILDIVSHFGLRLLFNRSNHMTLLMLLQLHVPDLASSAVLSALMALFEYSSAILTIIRSVQAFRAGGPWSNHKGGFMYLIFEQGAAAPDNHSIVSLTATCTLILNFTGLFAQRILNAYNLPLSCVLTARFLLYLREWEFKHSHN